VGGAELAKGVGKIEPLKPSAPRPSKREQVRESTAEGTTAGKTEEQVPKAELDKALKEMEVLKKRLLTQDNPRSSACSVM
jgi:hypothetical protein